MFFKLLIGNELPISKVLRILKFYVGLIVNIWTLTSQLKNLDANLQKKRLPTKLGPTIKTILALINRTVIFILSDWHQNLNSQLECLKNELGR